MQKAVFISLVLFFFIAQPSYAHKDGCHRWHSCPSDTGSYVCGDLGNTSECGGTVQQPVQPIQEQTSTNTPIPARIYPTWTPYLTRKPYPTKTTIPTRTPTPTITMTPAPTATPSPTIKITKVKKIVNPTPTPEHHWWDWMFGR